MKILNVGRLIRVSIILSPMAASRGTFGTLLLGTDNASQTEEIKTYSSYDELIETFDVETEVAKAAQLYFSQSPKPTTLKVAPMLESESLSQFAARINNIDSNWYGLVFATTATHTEQNFIDCAATIEAITAPHVFGITTSNASVIDPSSDSDIASQLKLLNLNRSIVQYSENKYAVCSFFGRAFTVNFNENASTITLMYKVEPAVVPEQLDTTEADALKAKNCNVFVQYNNDTAIIQYGVVSSGAYFDEIHGLDWLKNALQTELWNALYTTTKKIPQTDSGQNQLVSVCSSVINEAVNNGLVAPGQWNSDGFGQLKNGDYLPSGYYIYTELMQNQPQSIREQRIAPPIQIAVKLAGAIHEIDCSILVNR